MADQKNSRKKDSQNEEVLAAISAFEQILEAMPNDRGSLEALYHAYERLGKKDKSLEYLIQLGNVLIEEEDFEAANEMLNVLEEHSEESTEAAELIERIKDSGTEDPTGDIQATEQIESPVKVKASSEGISYNFNMADELTFAWNLLEENELTQEEYANVVQDITEMSAGEAVSTVSLLHALDHRTFKNLEKIVARVSQSTETPVVSLAGFDIPDEVSSVMPMDFMFRRGAIAFGFIGSGLMVAVMNPYSEQLRADIRQLTGLDCYFYMCLPSEFDGALDKTMQVLADSSSESSE